MGAEMEFLPAGQLLGMNTSPIIAAFSSQTRESHQHKSMLLFSAPEWLYTLRVPCVVFVNTALT